MNPNYYKKNEQANNGVSNINMRYPELSQQCWLSPMLCNVIFFRNHSGSCPSTMQRGPVWHQCWQLPVGFQQKHGDKWLSEHVPVAYGSKVNVRLFFSSSFVYFLNLANIKLSGGFFLCVYIRETNELYLTGQEAPMSFQDLNEWCVINQALMHESVLSSTWVKTQEGWIKIQPSCVFTHWTLQWNTDTSFYCLFSKDV